MRSIEKDNEPRSGCAGTMRVLKGAVAAGFALTLLACGGGGSSEPNAASSDVTDGAAAAATPTDVRALAAGATDATWTRVAVEHQGFSVQGTQTVRYGIGSSFVTKVVSGSGECSNEWFGIDPAYGIVKACDADGVDPGSVAWSKVADEDQIFTVAGTQTVRYGTGSVWVTKTTTGTSACSNAAFGFDPVVGVRKECDVSGSAPVDGGWTRIAAEGSSFTVAGTQTVRYGSGAGWVQKSVTNGGECTNGWFGTDPAVGVYKQCEVAGAGAAPAPAPVVAAGVCTPPVNAADTSSRAASVGNGTAASCTEAALRQAIAGNDVVTFNCGADPVTIAVRSPISIPTDRDTVIDGGNKVTLDGGGATRLLSLMRLDYRTNTKGLTLQHIALANARAPGTGYVPQDPNNPRCAWGYGGGGGGAIEVRDARLHVIDVDFRSNAAASPGPDIGGGAIYAMGSLDVTVVGSRFSGNTGSNAGAVGLLQSNGRFVNSAFDGNSATGTGMNGDLAGCPGVAYPGQSGAGGNGGAIGVDGSDDTDLLVCGSRFTNNAANELAGALARTPNYSPRRTTIDRSVFDGNRARQAGALFILNSAPLDIVASTFSNNSAISFGAAQIERGRLNIVNSTFAGNEARQGVGGALLLGSLDGSSTILNATFANNRSQAGSGYFSAAIFGQLDFPVNNTVFSNNTTYDGGSPMTCTWTPTSGSGDMQWPRNHLVGNAPDVPCVQGIAFADPQLGALAENGGPSATLLPAASSPLRGSGQNCPSTDQRGQLRNTGACTIGAVE